MKKKKQTVGDTVFTLQISINQVNKYISKMERMIRSRKTVKNQVLQHTADDFGG